MKTASLSALAFMAATIASCAPLDNSNHPSCSQDVPIGPDGTSPIAQLALNASDLYGWQLASFIPASYTQNGAACKDFQANPGLAPQIGFSAQIISNILCAREGCDARSGTSNILSHIYRDASKIFLLDLIYAFQPSKSTFNFFCNRLDPRRVGALFHGDTSSIDYVCQQAGCESPSASGQYPFESGTVPAGELAALQSNRSASFAYEVLGTANDLAEINDICSNFGAFGDNAKLLTLSADAVHATICSQTATSMLFTADQLIGFISVDVSYIAATTVFEASGSRAWQQFLCAGAHDGSWTNWSRAGLEAIAIVPDTVFSYLLPKCGALSLA